MCNNEKMEAEKNILSKNSICQKEKGWYGFAEISFQKHWILNEKLSNTVPNKLSMEHLVKRIREGRVHQLTRFIKTEITLTKSI